MSAEDEVARPGDTHVWEIIQREKTGKVTLECQSFTSLRCGPAKCNNHFARGFFASHRLASATLCPVSGAELTANDYNWSTPVSYLRAQAKKAELAEEEREAHWLFYGLPDKKSRCGVIYPRHFRFYCEIWQKSPKNPFQSAINTGWPFFKGPETSAGDDKKRKRRQDKTR